MDSCECGDTGNDGNGDKGPEHCRNREKEQKTCQFVGRSVREAESFADYQRKDMLGMCFTLQGFSLPADCVAKRRQPLGRNLFPDSGHKFQSPCLKHIDESGTGGRRKRFSFR